MAFLKRRSAPRTESQGFGHAELTAGGTRVVIIPEVGGKIASLEMAGRQWLWTNPSIPFRSAAAGAQYADAADSGGIDECFPTVASCSLPPVAEAFAGATLPDHGDLWSQRPTIDVTTGTGASQAVLEWRGTSMPFRFTRVVRVEGDGQVVMRYSVRNEGKQRMPFIWSGQALFPLGDRTRLILPIGEPIRIYRAERIDMGGTGSEHRWPVVRTAKEVFDLSRPVALKKRFAAKIFFDGVSGTAGIEEGDARLEVRFDPAEVPDLGVWINNRGWSPKRGISPYQNVGIMPGIGAPDTLGEALGGWRRPHWLKPGETREWGLAWVGRKKGAEDDDPRRQ